MKHSRRTFLLNASATAGAITFLPFAASAGGHAANEFKTPNGGLVTVHPVAHASIVLETPAGVIYVDPVGDPEQYADMPAADMVLVTHEHGDHMNAATLAVIAGDTTPIVTNAGAFAKMAEMQMPNATVIANGESTEPAGVMIEAIPAYNTTEERLNFHPQGRDNGYVLTVDGMRIYISGDTEGTPEMRALENIDLAFVCMNLPFTMTAEAAADAVAEFKPTYVYPYHYRGRDGGTQDPNVFADLMEGKAEVRMGNWYG